MFGILSIIVLMASACARKADSKVTSSTDPQGIVASALGSKALSANETALTGLYELETDKAPAAVRPDPDLYIRQLLRLYRDEGTVIAKEIGRVEDYRPLLGGASQDFITKPQEGYDATSLLATAKVAEEICEGLVSPNSSDHPGWNTILPASPTEVETNLLFLSQRFIGLPSKRIPSSVITQLTSLVNDAKINGVVTNKSYIPACVALSLDAEALLL